MRRNSCVMSSNTSRCIPSAMTTVVMTLTTASRFSASAADAENITADTPTALTIPMTPRPRPTSSAPANRERSASQRYRTADHTSTLTVAMAPENTITDIGTTNGAARNQTAEISMTRMGQVHRSARFGKARAARMMIPADQKVRSRETPDMTLCSVGSE